MRKIKMSTVAGDVVEHPVHAEIGTKAACEHSANANRALVLAFYRQALVERQVRAAFEKHVCANFVDHKPDLPNGTRAAAISFLEDLLRELPHATWEIVRTVAENDLVVLHVRFVATPSAPPYAIADLFRIENCFIAEHWDVVAQPRAEQPNPHSRF